MLLCDVAWYDASTCIMAVVCPRPQRHRCSASHYPLAFFMSGLITLSCPTLYTTGKSELHSPLIPFKKNSSLLFDLLLAFLSPPSMASPSYSFFSLKPSYFCLGLATHHHFTALVPTHHHLDRLSVSTFLLRSILPFESPPTRMKC